MNSWQWLRTPRFIRPSFAKPWRLSMTKRICKCLWIMDTSKVHYKMSLTNMILQFEFSWRCWGNWEQVPRSRPMSSGHFAKRIKQFLRSFWPKFNSLRSSSWMNMFVGRRMAWSVKLILTQHLLTWPWSFVSQSMWKRASVVRIVACQLSQRSLERSLEKYFRSQKSRTRSVRSKRKFMLRNLLKPPSFWGCHHHRLWRKEANLSRMCWIWLWATFQSSRRSHLPKEKAKAKAKAKSKGSTKAQPKNAAAKAKQAKEKKVAVEKPAQEHQYQAGDYAANREKYIQDLMEKNQCSWKTAAQSWNGSMERATLLQYMSVGELKRRRFISKEVQENPFFEYRPKGQVGQEGKGCWLICVIAFHLYMWF